MTKNGDSGAEGGTALPITKRDGISSPRLRDISSHGAHLIFMTPLSTGCSG